MQQTIHNLTLGATYKLAVWARSPGSNLEITYSMENTSQSDDNPTRSCHVTDAWTECTWSFVTIAESPAAFSSSALLSVGTDYPAGLELDDFSIVQKAVNLNLVQNGGFEDGSSHAWEQLQETLQCNFHAVDGHTSAHKL